MIQRTTRCLLLYALLIGVMAWMFIHLPTSFLPDEDRGVFMAQLQLPFGSTQQQTLKVVEKVENYFMTQEKDNVLSVFSTVGAGPGGNGHNVARLFIRLKNWEDRASADRSSFAIIERATKAFNKIARGEGACQQPGGHFGAGQFRRL